MLRKEIFLNSGGYKDYYPCEDAELWVRLLLRGARFANIQTPLINYRTSNEQSLRQNRSLPLAKNIKREFLESLTGQEFNSDDYDLILPVQACENRNISDKKVYKAIHLINLIYNEFLKKGLFLKDNN